MNLSSVSVPVEALGLTLEPSDFLIPVILVVLGIAFFVPVFALINKSEEEAEAFGPAMLLAIISGILLACGIGGAVSVMNEDRFEIVDQTEVEVAMSELGLDTSNTSSDPLRIATVVAYHGPGYFTEDMVQLDGSTNVDLGNGRTLVAKVSDDRTQVTYSIR